MSWVNVSKYLERFSVIKPSNDWAKEEIVKVLNNFFNNNNLMSNRIEFDLKDIEFKNGVVFIKISNAVLKNEIFLRKNQILDELKQRFHKHPPIDIRVG